VGKNLSGFSCDLPTGLPTLGIQPNSAVVTFFDEETARWPPTNGRDSFLWVLGALDLNADPRIVGKQIFFESPHGPPLLEYCRHRLVLYYEDIEIFAPLVFACLRKPRKAEGRGPSESADCGTPEGPELR